jgi:hypothetical protein
MIDPEILSFGDSVPVAADSNLIEDAADSPQIGFVRHTCKDQFVDMHSNYDAEVFVATARSIMDCIWSVVLIGFAGSGAARVCGETRLWICRTKSFARRPFILPQSVSCFFEMVLMI